MADNFVYGNMSERNRAYDTRRDNDSFKTPSITLYDVDYAILYFLKETMNLKLEENGKTVDIPVMYASGEVWSQIQRHGYMRDKTRKLLTPMIVLKRSSVSPDDRFPQLDVRGEGRTNSLLIRSNRSPAVHTIFPDIQSHDRYDFNQETENSKRNVTYFISTVPEYIKCFYDVFIWTELNSQMNYIIESLLPQSRLVWGDEFKFTTKVGEMSIENLNDTGQDRLVRCQFQLEVDGRLLQEYELHESNITKAHSIKRFVFENELEQTEIYPDHKPKIIRFGKSRLPKRNFD